MRLPEGFVFSQSSLQDYDDCPRRFELRYLERRRWPAPRTADALELEQRMQRGYAFHRLMRRLHSGISPQALEPAVAVDAVLQRWWVGYLRSPPEKLPDSLVHAELALSTKLLRYRLEARFDLLAGQPGNRWVIVDWKTSMRRAPRSWLAQRLQTHVYPFVLVRAGEALNGDQPVTASQVEMIYWFAQFPAQAEVFHYGEEAYRDDESMLGGIVLEIEGRPKGGFPKADNRRLCRYCVYRSLCWGDVKAGPLSELDDAEALGPLQEEVDLEQIVAIPY